MERENLFNVIKTRHSCRAYSSRKVEEEKLDKVIEAGIYAPTGMNKQCTIFLAIQDEKTVQRLSRLNASIMGRDGDPFYGAKTVVVVLAKKESRTYLYDGSLAAGYMLLEADALGLASCWIHRAKESFESEEGKAILKEAGITDEVEGIANIILGYDDETNPKPHAKSSEGRIFKL
jgi:nitroreductase